MARQKGIETHIEVTKGFATEINPVISTPEVLIDVDNCILSRNGTIRRRLGVDFEDSFSINLVDSEPVELGELNTFAFTTELWTSVDNIGTLNIVVQQIGTALQFYSQFGALSSNLLGDIDLAEFAVDLPSLGITPMQIASGLGKLFVVSPVMEPVVISFSDGAFEAEQTLIQIRDFTGLDDELAIDERPFSLSDEHHYNLLNQGWNEENITTFRGSGFNYPSNSDIMTVGIVVNKDGDLEFDPEFIREDALGNTPAPKGHFILDAFNKDYLAVSGINIETVTTNKRPEAIAFHQGRIFYSSPATPDVNSGFFYSQQLLQLDRRGLCFQEADPTAAEINDLISTDGGFIPTPSVGQVYSMQEMSNGVVTFASNGVWYLTGAEVGSAVTATSLRLDKIYSSGVLGASSVVEGEGAIYFFGEEGIMRVAITLEGGSVENISKSSIQSFYTAIDTLSRSKAVSVFIPTERKVFWGYMDDPDSGFIDRFLILDLDVGGYYKYSITLDDEQTYPRVVGMSRVAPLALNVESSTVLTIDGSFVTESDGTTLITSEAIVDSSQTVELKLATMTETGTSGEFGLTFSTFDNLNLRDWSEATAGGEGLPMVATIDFAQTAMGGVHLKATPIWVHTYFTKCANATVEMALITGGAFGCTSSVDVVLLLDVSNSMKSSGFLTSDTKPAIKAMIADIFTEMDDVSMAIDAFSTNELHILDFTSNVSDLQTAVDTAYDSAISGLSTDLGKGLDLSALTLVNSPLSRPSVIFLITDGVANRPIESGQQAGATAAATLRDSDIEVYVAGIGGRDGFAVFYLETVIANTPDFYSQIDAFTDMAVELLKPIDCPSTVPAPFDYLNAVIDTNWTYAVGPFDMSGSKVMWVQELGLYIAGTEANSYGGNTSANIWTSPDGLVWTPRDTLLSTSVVYDITYSASLGLAMTIGVQDSFNSSPGCRTSPDGITWTAVQMPDDDAFYYGVIWNEAELLFVATGGQGVYTSPDGSTWTKRSTIGCNKLAYSDSLGLFVALVRNASHVLTSSDAITWTLVTDVLDTGSWWDIAWSDEEEIFVAVSVSNSTHDMVNYSTNGTSWSTATVPGGQGKGRTAVEYFPVEGKLFSTAADGNDSIIISSADGITWVEEAADVNWPSSARLGDIARKSATEWVVISWSADIWIIASTANPF